MSKSILLAGATALAITAYTAPALAQDAPTEEPEARQDTIIITGRKKEETLLDAPISVSAFSSETLQAVGALNARDIADLTPGLQINGDFGRTGERPVIRGISNLRAETAQPVGLFIDGVYIRTGIISSILDNVERVEVLKGPQGALYGRSTYGGVINYISKTPGDEFGGNISLTYGEHDQIEGTARIEGPIAPGLNVAVGGQYYEYGGEYDNINPNTAGAREVGSEKTTALYGQLNFQPVDTPEFEGNFRVYYSKDEDGQFAGQLFDSTFNNSVAGGGTACPEVIRSFYCGEAITPDNVNIATSLRAGENTSAFFGGLPAPWDFKAGLDREVMRITGDLSYELTDTISILYQGGLTTEETHNVVNQSYSPTIVGNSFGSFPSAWVTDDMGDREYWSHEVRLNGELNENMTWIIGAFAFGDESSGRDRDILQADYEFDGATQNDERTIFAALDIDVTDKIGLGFEGRAYEEDVEAELATGQMLSETFDGFTYRVTADYNFDNGALLYGSISTGNKAGGFNTNVNPTTNPEFVSYDEETAMQFELGYKAEYYDGRLRFDSAVFAIDLEDQQISQVVQLPNAQGGFDQVTVVLNAGQTEIRGAELNVQGDFTDNLTLGLAWAYANSEFTEGTDPTQATILPSDTLVGFKVPRVSENSGTIMGEYTFPSYGAWETNLRVDGIYASSRFAQVQNLTETGESFKTNARLTFSNEEHGTDLVIWGRNVFDDDTPSNVFRYVDPGDFRFFARAHVVFLPRGSQFGATVRKRF